MSDGEKNEELTKKDALDHAWSWFSLHATQRMQSVNFFLVAVAFLCAAYVTAVKEELYVVSAGISLIGLIASYIFYRMGRRVRTLLHASRLALSALQEEMATKFNLDSLKMVSHVNDAKPGEWKYKTVFWRLNVTFSAAFTGGFLYSCWMIIAKRSPEPTVIGVVQSVAGSFLVLIGFEMLLSIPEPAEEDPLRHKTRIAVLVAGIVSIFAGVVVILVLAFSRG